MLAFVLRNNEGEFVSKNGYWTNDQDKAMIFTTYEEASNYKIVLSALNEDYYKNIFVDSY